MKIFIGADHRGIEMKAQILKHYNDSIELFEIKNSEQNDDDYVDYAKEVSMKVAETNGLGILICGNGIGMSIAANKIKGIRCARVWSTDDAYKAKNHNGANMIAFGADLELELVYEIIDMFINTPSASEERHLRRIEKINNLEA